jgi:hypothetical protein
VICAPCTGLAARDTGSVLLINMPVYVLKYIVKHIEEVKARVTAYRKLHNVDRGRNTPFLRKKIIYLLRNAVYLVNDIL